MKISKAQQEVLAQAIKEIRLAKKLDFSAWLITSSNILDPDAPGLTDKERENRLKRIEEIKEEGRYYRVYRELRENIAYIHCNSQTLRSLAAKCLIEIIRDSAGDRYGIDKIKLKFDVSVS